MLVAWARVHNFFENSTGVNAERTGRGRKPDRLSRRCTKQVALDWRKPNGLFVIQPAEVEDFLIPLPVGRIPGVGKVTEEKLAALGLRSVAELRARSLEELETRRSGFHS